MIDFIHRYGSYVLLLTLAFAILIGLHFGEAADIILVYTIDLLFGFALVSFITFYNRLHKSKPQTAHHYKATTTHMIILDIIYVSLFILELFVLQLCEVRPTIYFIIISTLTGVTTLSILISKDNQSTVKNIVKILSLSLLSTLSIFKCYVMIGYDTWTHLAWNELISKFGFIYEGLGKEMATPIEHVAVAITDVIVGVDVRIASIIAVSIPLTLLAVVIFIVGKKYCNTICGLISMIIYLSLEPILYWSSAIQTTSYAYMIILPIVLLYVLWKRGMYKYNRYLLLLLILILTYVYTHTFSAVILIGLSTTIYIGSIVITRNIVNKELIVFIVLIMSAVLNLISNLWTGTGSLTVFHVVVTKIYTQITNIGQKITETANLPLYVNITPPSLIELFIEHSFELVLTCTVLLLILIIIKNPLSKVRLFEWTILSLTLVLTLILGFVIFTVQEMALRITPYLCLIIGLAIGIILYHCCYGSVGWHLLSRTQIFIIISCVVVISFLGCANTNVNSDNPLWLKDNTEPNGITVAEADGIMSVIPYLINPSSNVTFDHVMSPTYGYYLYEYSMSRKSNSEVRPIVIPSNIRWDDVGVNNDRYLVFRDSVLTRTTMQYYADLNFKQYTKLGTPYITNLDHLYPRTYSNGHVELYLL